MVKVTQSKVRSNNANNVPETNKLPLALSENVLTLLCLSAEHGKLVSELVEPNQFDNQVHTIYASQAIAFWKKHKKPPGKGHVADIVFDYLSKDNPRNQSYRACLNGMLALEHAGINSEYVLDQLSTLQRTSALRHATLRAAELLESREHLAIEDVERVYHDVLKAKPASNEDLALDCADIRGLANYLDQRQEQEFITGIPELDRCGTIPARGKLMIVLAYTGVGKSWCLVHLAKKAAVRCRKVLYVTLELPKHEVQRRIYQSFGHAPINEFGLTTTETELQLEDERLIGFEAEERTAECHLGNPRKTNLKVLADIAQGREHVMRRIKVSHFPMRSLSVQQLEAHLDKLEAVEGFVPDMLMVDYLGVLKLKGREEMRVELGAAVQELHALGSTRNIAVVAASQVNREGGKARMTTGMHAAEDASMTWTANIVLAISRNDLEKRLGLAKLRVDKNRDGIDGFEVLLTQNLAHGQFRRASTRLPSNYDDLLKNLVEGR